MIASHLTAWWTWIILGLALLGLELALPGGFFLVFFGLSSLIVGILVLCVTGIEVWIQWIIFTCLSVLLLLVFRNRLVKAISSSDKQDVDSLVSQQVELRQNIAVGGMGEVSFRGTSWQVLNIGATDLAVGSRAKIIAVEGILLKIEGLK